MAAATVGRVREVSSSESSDEDETSRLQEAAVLDCHHSSSASNGKTGKSIPSSASLPRTAPNDVSSRPSLRASREESRELENDLNTTPAFRAFVSKKLSQIVDSMVEISEMKTAPCASTASNEETAEVGVRLFSSSTRPVSLEDDTLVRKSVPKRHVESSSSDSSEDERLASAAVSHEFIFKDTTFSGSSNSCKSDPTNTNCDVVKLKKSKKKKKKKVQDLSEMSPQSIEHDAGGTVDVDEDHSEQDNPNTNKKCKKKKKKKKVKEKGEF